MNDYCPDCGVDTMKTGHLTECPRRCTCACDCYFGADEPDGRCTYCTNGRHAPTLEG